MKLAMTPQINEMVGSLEKEFTAIPNYYYAVFIVFVCVFLIFRSWIKNSEENPD